MRTVAIIQARMGSSRLPGKVLKDIGGKPMLLWAVERARRATRVDAVGVATTDDPADDPIAALCTAHEIPVFRGSVFDVLDRFYRAAQAFRADVVVRVTGDCPLIDPGVMDETIAAFFESGVDFAANRLPPPWKRTYPIGLDTEVCSFAGLERAWREAAEPYEREHVMPYFYDQDGRFRVRVVDHDPDYGALRWTVDTPADLELLRQIVERFEGREDFSWLEVLELVQREPELTRINADVAAKQTQEVDPRALGGQP